MRPPIPAPPPPAGATGTIPSSGGTPPLNRARHNGRLDPNSALARVLDTVDRFAQAARARTEPIQRGAAVARKLPAILFGVTLAVVGVTFLLIAVLRGLVEVTDAAFGDPKAWVAWLVSGGILLVVSVFIGTVRNRGTREG